MVPGIETRSVHTHALPTYSSPSMREFLRFHFLFLFLHFSGLEASPSFSFQNLPFYRLQLKDFVTELGHTWHQFNKKAPTLLPFNREKGFTKCFIVDQGSTKGKTQRERVLLGQNKTRVLQLWILRLNKPKGLHPSFSPTPEIGPSLQTTSLLYHLLSKVQWEN